MNKKVSSYWISKQNRSSSKLVSSLMSPSGGGTSEGENCWISFLFYWIFGWWNWGWWPWFLISMYIKYKILNQNLNYKIIFPHGPDRHSPPQEITLEIWMIQGEPGLISKEQVLHSLVLIICCLKLAIWWLFQTQNPTTMLRRIWDGKLPWMKRWILFRKTLLGS